MDSILEDKFLAGLEANKGKLLRICSVYANDREERDDLFQEALMNIWKSLPNFKAEAAISTWMFRITINVCLRRRTQLATNKHRFVTMDSVELARFGGADAEGEAVHPRLDDLRACLKSLNESDKAIMTLYLEELPYREIGAVTGLTENHVAVKVKRIKNKLLNCINKRA